MNLDAEDLLAQIKKDWPGEYEMSTLRALADMQDRRIQAQDAEIADLKAQLGSLGQPGGYQPSVVRPYVGTAQISDLDDGARHGG